MSATPQYILVGLCLYLAMFAFWKGEAAMGFSIMGAAYLVYWALVAHFSDEWTR